MEQASVFDLLSEPVRNALREVGISEATPPQSEAIPKILAGENLLLVAPTGSGKTEAALLPIFNQLAQISDRKGIYLLYITPLRALNRDLLKRLISWSARLNFTVEVRHGDTPAKERRRQSVKPPDLLVTTPETLQAILPGRRMQKHLKSVRWVVVDEVHELAEDRRGTQLTVGLERLTKIVRREFQRIGLSVTVGNPQEVAQFLAGAGRAAEVVQIAVPKGVKYFVEHPYPTEEDHALAPTLYTSPDGAARLNRISELIDSHSSTLLFVNSRTNAELLGSKLHMLRKDVAVHHGSLPREERTQVETSFKEGTLRALVCTSTLELGIDIGSVDLVIQYMSPRQISTLIQRVGRSGHRLDRLSEGVVVAVSTDDVLEAVAAVQKAWRGELEPLTMHTNALDVLAHQIVGCMLDEGGKAKESDIRALIRGAYPYSRLADDDFRKVVDFLVKLRYLWIEGEYLATARGARKYYFENLSMIPDERRYPVIDITTQQKVGILGEEFMMLKARVGLNFIVKGRVWRIAKIGEDGNVYVTPVEDPTAAIPGWDGELLPVPFELAQHVGGLREQAAAALTVHDVEAAAKVLKDDWAAESYARRRVLEELQEHVQMGAPLPTDRRIVVEGFERYLIVHGCFGEVVNGTLGELFEELLMRKGLIRFWWADGYRILVELTVNTQELDFEELVNIILRPSKDVVEGAFKSIIHRHAPFGYYMKFVAERFGVLKRGLSLGGTALKELPLKFKLTPIFDETVRETLLKHLNFERADKILAEVKDGTIEVRVYRAKDRPTPIAYHILNRYVEIPELIAPETVAKDNVERMKLALGNEYVNLLCFNCGQLTEPTFVKTLPERPACPSCGAGLLGVVFWSAPFVRDALMKKKMQRIRLSEDEEKAVVRARRSADLVLSYGKKAVVAQCVYGVGPQTASKILAKMHDDEAEFYKDLLGAKLQFITTRPFWDRA